jgi:hypothetical protein
MEADRETAIEKYAAARGNLFDISHCWKSLAKGLIAKT